MSLTVETFLERFPWSKEQLTLGKPLDFLWTFDLDASPSELWPFAMDTSHFNRAMGMGRFEYREVDGVLHGSTRNAGVLQTWIEEPWTWIARRTLTSGRLYDRGFARYVRGIYLLERIETGTRFHVYFGWIPRSALYRTFLSLAFPSLKKPYERVLRAITAHIRDVASARNPYVAPPPVLEVEALERVASLTKQLRAQLDEGQHGVLEKLVEYVTTTDEMDLHRIQLVPLSRRWNAPIDDVVTVALFATRAGLLNLSWDVICPHCRGVRVEAATLGDVTSRGRCDVCDIDFDTGEANAIEITFHLHPSVRDIPKVQFCAAEPSTKSHIHVKQALASGEARRIETSLDVGTYRVRIDGEQRYRLLEIATDAPRELTIDAGDAPLRAGPAPTLDVHASEACTLVIEHASWSDDALRPERLLSMQRFRDLFSADYLKADVQISVGEQTILFTDMIGSTKFYDTHGDAGAFAEVKKHFMVVYDVIRKRRGAVIKTIGDAVMAAFHDPVDALEASVAIHRAFHSERTDTPVRLRISMNRGPCIAVNLNSAIDYFGRTVNAASKLQACVEAGQIAFPRALAEDPSVRAYLEREDAKLEEVVVTSASLSEPIPAYRWDVSGRR